MKKALIVGVGVAIGLSFGGTVAAESGTTVYNTGLCHKTPLAAQAQVDPQGGTGPLVGIEHASSVKLPAGTWENSPFPTGTACSRAEWGT